MADEFYNKMQTKAFEAQLRQLPQSTQTLFPLMTNEGNETGEEAYFNQNGSLVARKGKTRGEKHKTDQGKYYRRRVTPEMAYLATELDGLDQVKSIVDPKSSLARNVKFALQRQMTQDALKAMFGTAYVGKAGASTENFNTDDIIGVQVGAESGNAGINADKIYAGVERIQNQGFNLSDPQNELSLVMGPPQATNAKMDDKLANYDYLTNRIMAGIDIPDGFLGIRNVITDAFCPYANGGADADGIVSSWTDNGLAKDDTGSGVRMAILFIKSAVSYAMWEDFVVRVSELQDQHYDWQLYSRVVYGITRMFKEGGIVGILCDESA